jgi:3-oxoadipate enol-lactonase
MVSVELHHRFDGPEDAPVLVLSNSLGTTHAMWDPQLQRLTERFRVLRFDTRGHGESAAPPGPYSLDELGRDALALLDRLELERVSWCGLSLGGMLGMWAASEAPERFDRLVLACTSARIGPPEMWDERIQETRSKGMEALADGALERWLTPEFRAARPELADWLRAMVAATPAEGYAACCEAIRDMELADRLPRIEAPTLVIAASDDPATPPQDHARPIADAIAGARLVVLDRARHLASVEHPDAFADAMLEHLDG